MVPWLIRTAVPGLGGVHVFRIFIAIIFARQIDSVSPMLKRIRARGVARAVVWPEPFTGVARERLELRRI